MSTSLLSELVALNLRNLEIHDLIALNFTDKLQLIIPNSINTIHFNGKRLNFEVGDVVCPHVCNVQSIVEQHEVLSVFRVEIKENDRPDLSSVIDVLKLLKEEGSYLLVEWKEVMNEIYEVYQKMEAFMANFDGLDEFIYRIFRVQSYETVFVTSRTSSSWTFKLPIKELSRDLLESISEDFHRLYTITASIGVKSKGYTILAEDYYQMNPRMALCAMSPSPIKTWEDIHSVCNEEGGFALPSSPIMRALGPPTEEEWEEARLYFKSKGYTHVITGQLCRGYGGWEDGAMDYQRNTFGLIDLKDRIGSPNWRDILSGDSDPERSWHYANTLTSTEKLVTLSVNASAIPGAYIQHHIWRLDE